MIDIVINNIAQSILMSQSEKQLVSRARNKHNEVSQLQGGLTDCHSAERAFNKV